MTETWLFALVIVIGAVAVAVGVGSKPKDYFCPQKDITAYEVALIVHQVDPKKYPEISRHICNSAGEAGH